MVVIPKTSVGLLNAIAVSHESDRWHEFYGLYQPVIAAYIQKNFPSLEADEVIQEAMIAFVKKVPTYRYDPQMKGFFHNYLLGIAKFKAFEALRRRSREASKLDTYKDGSPETLNGVPEETVDEVQIAEAAIWQFLHDDTVNVRDREIFRRIIPPCSESPESVAKAYGITRNNVDQIKSRAMGKVREIAKDMMNMEA